MTRIVLLTEILMLQDLMMFFRLLLMLGLLEFGCSAFSMEVEGFVNESHLKKELSIIKKQQAEAQAGFIFRSAHDIFVDTAPLVRLRGRLAAFKLEHPENPFNRELLAYYVAAKNEYKKIVDLKLARREVDNLLNGAFK